MCSYNPFRIFLRLLWASFQCLLLSRWVKTTTVFMWFLVRLLQWFKWHPDCKPLTGLFLASHFWLVLALSFYCRRFPLVPPHLFSCRQYWHSGKQFQCYIQTLKYPYSQPIRPSHRTHSSQWIQHCSSLETSQPGSNSPLSNLNQHVGNFECTSTHPAMDLCSSFFFE